MRRRRQQFSQEVIKEKQQVAKPQSVAESLRPDRHKIHLAKNQLNLAWQHAKQFSSDAKQVLKAKPWRNRKKDMPNQEKSITIPKTHPLKKTTAAAVSRLRQVGHSSAQSVSLKTATALAAFKTWRAARKDRRQADLPKAAPLPEKPAPAPSVAAKRPSIKIKPAPAPLAPRKVQSQLVTPIFFKRTEKPSPLRLAEEALAGKQYQAAESILVPYIMDHVKDTSAYMLLGQSALQQGHWEEAFEIFEQVVLLGTDEPGAHANAGYAAFRAGHYGKALPHLQRALDEDPTDQQVLESLLRIARTMDNQPLARSIQAKLSEMPEKQSAAS